LQDTAIRRTHIAGFVNIMQLYYISFQILQYQFALLQDKAESCNIHHPY